MARILGIDYGTKRVGIAETDPLKIIASPLKTIDVKDVLEYLKSYISEEEVETIVVGRPLHHDGNETHLTALVDKFVLELEKLFSNINVVTIEEDYTSVDAQNILFQSGIRKKKRRDKTLLDKISASIILQNYMERYL